MIIVVGGGAAGFFAAITAKANCPDNEVYLLERHAALLSKVRVSGGGRCNVTHACFDPKELSKNYPRGHKELIGPFHRFQPTDTIKWFDERGVTLKTEEDGRMFPTTDNSQTIIDCLLKEAAKLGVIIKLKQKIETIEKTETGFRLCINDESVTCDKLILATGSSPQGHTLAQALGHSIVTPVPSLFTFNVPSSPLLELSGVSVDEATVKLAGTNLQQTGPLLLTHWGFSGPAALKLSAWGARYLAEKEYRVELLVDWLPKLSKEEVLQKLQLTKKNSPNQTLATQNLFGLPKSLWKKLLESFDGQKRLAEISNEVFVRLTALLKGHSFQVNGKTTHKEEFVTCGGVELSEVHFKNMESKLFPGLHFAGEILNIDAVTGGFNFQNAWTTGWLAGQI